MSSTNIKKIFRPIVPASLIVLLCLMGAPISASAASPSPEKTTSQSMFKTLCRELREGTVICTITADKVKLTCAVSKDMTVLACLRSIKKSEIKRTFQVSIPAK